MHVSRRVVMDYFLFISIGGKIPQIFLSDQNRVIFLFFSSMQPYLYLFAIYRDHCSSPRLVLDSPISFGTRQSLRNFDFYKARTLQNFQKCLLDLLT